MSLRITNQVWELAAETIVAVAVFVDLALLLALSAKVADELSLGVVKTAANSHTKTSHSIELLHSRCVVVRKHLLPLGQLLLVIELLNSHKELRAASNTTARATDRVHILRQQLLAATDRLHGLRHVLLVIDIINPRSLALS